jgi:hypothetical protein
MPRCYTRARCVSTLALAIRTFVLAPGDLAGKVFGPIDDSPFGRLAALADPAGANFKIVQLPTNEC